MRSGGIEKKLNMYYKIILIAIFSYTSIAFTQNIFSPYDSQCSQYEQQRTTNITTDLSLTEANFCENCQRRFYNLFDIYLSVKNWKNTLIGIPKECFLAMAIRGDRLFSSSQYVHCKSKNNAYFTRKQKLCINKDYIDMIHKAWLDISECFNYDIKRQQEIFHLINQESGGILNIKSGTGARCLGQVTIDYVKTINNYITAFEKNRPLQQSGVYQEVTNRCPRLKEKVLKNINFITCQTSMDPYMCLFYTFYGLESNHRMMKKTFNSHSDYMGSREFPEDIKDKYQLPIKLNEMLTISGTTKNGNSFSWVVWDDSELYYLWKKIDDSKDLTIKKTPLFKKQEDIEQMFNYWAHNGGQSLVGNSLAKRVERLKRILSQSCKTNSQEIRCLARNQIADGNGIDSSLALKIFEADLKSTYPNRSLTRRLEVAKYVRNIMNSNQKVFNYNEDTNYTNSMLHFYKQVQPNSNEEERVAFQKQISSICPKLNFK